MIDTHVHVVSGDFERYPSKNRERILARLGSVPGDCARVLAVLRSAGVEAACLVQEMSVYGDDNSYILDCAASEPERFVGVIHVSCSDAKAEEHIEGWAKRGAVGLRLSASAGLDRAEDLGSQRVSELLLEATTCGLSLELQVLFHEVDQVKKLFERAPGISVVLDHCCLPPVDALIGGPPYHAARSLFELAELEGVWLKVTTANLDMARLATADARPFVAALVQAFGAERIMWGSAWSSTHDRGYDTLVGQARNAFSALSTHEQAMCLHSNPLRFWPKLGIVRAAEHDRG